jgi:hypothetical protein
MRTCFVLVLVLAPLLSALPQKASRASFLGAWEGESKCTVPDSPCHDEQVLFSISVDNKDPYQLKLDAYKLVDGAPDFMGTLTCQDHTRQSALSCTGDTSQKDDWEFHLFGDAMSGTLRIDDGKTLYRRLTLRKSRAAAK